MRLDIQDRFRGSAPPLAQGRQADQEYRPVFGLAWRSIHAVRMA
jgi:hypothetical protein